MAHIGSLDAKGLTIAVLGSGVDYIYPIENKKIYYRMLEENSVILSEFPIGTKPLPYHFPQRNRIIAGLSIATVLIEASKKSGSLYTVDYALNYGREVYTYPGPANSPFYSGNHKILREGAKLIENFNDLYEDLKLVLDFEVSSMDAQPEDFKEKNIENQKKYLLKKLMLYKI